MATKQELEAEVKSLEGKLGRREGKIAKLEEELAELRAQAATTVDHGPVFGPDAVPLESR